MREFACVLVALALTSCAQQAARPYFQYNHAVNASREGVNSGSGSFMKMSSEEHELAALSSVLDLSNKFNGLWQWLKRAGEVQA